MIGEKRFGRNEKKSDTLKFKVSPHSVEAEQSILGGLMLENRRWDEIADRVMEEDFYRLEHRLIFRAISKLAIKNQPFDIVTISETLKQADEQENAGGEIYLYELAKNTPSAANIVAYAEIVREKAVQRKLINVGSEIIELGFNSEGQPSSDLLDQAEQKIFSIAEQGTAASEPQEITRLIAQTIDYLDNLSRSNNSITGVSTGFIDLDKLTLGLQKSDLIIVAGRPSMGKTAFALNIASHIAISNPSPVLVFSMEMSSSQLTMRLFSSLGLIDQQRVRAAKLDPDDWTRISSVTKLFSDSKLIIDDRSALSPNDIRARARRVSRQYGQLGLIVIDYLQLMQIPGFRETRALEVSQISRALKALAKELNVPIIALSQLNRSLEQRHDKRPIMSDLRDSGGLEQEADLIAFIYRDEVYDEESPDKGTAEIIIAKQRNGPIGKVNLAFLGKYIRFENLAPKSMHFLKE